MRACNSTLEPEIKTMVINHLLDKGLLSDNDLIINEFTVGDFSRRVDLALVSEKRMLAFEVKSGSDSLVRLEGQVDKYLEYFDKVTVVVATKHVSKTLELSPLNVAVWEVTDKGIIVRRKGRILENNSKEKLVDLMTVSELSKVARQFKLNPDCLKRKNLESIVSGGLSKKQLRTEALRFIRGRYKDRNDRFRMKVKESFSTPEDLKLLSSNQERIVSTDISTSITEFIEVLESIQKKVVWGNEVPH